MNIRKNIYTLTDAQLQAFQNAAQRRQGRRVLRRLHHSPPPLDDDRDAEPRRGRRRDVQQRGASRTGVPAVAPLLLPRAGARSSDEKPDRHLALLGLGRGCRQSPERSAVEYEPGAAHLYRRRRHRPGRRSRPRDRLPAGRRCSRDRRDTFVPRPGGIIRELGSNPDFGSGIGVPSFPTVAQVNDAIAELRHLRHLAVAHRKRWQLPKSAGGLARDSRTRTDRSSTIAFTSGWVATWVRARRRTIRSSSFTTATSIGCGRSGSTRIRRRPISRPRADLPGTT